MSGDIADKNSIEILQRIKRTETKVSKLMEKMGFADEAGERPVWQDGAVKVPTSEISLKIIMETIPLSWKGDVLVLRGRETIAVVRR